MNSKRDIPSPDASWARGFLVPILALPCALALLQSTAWSADNTQKEKNTLLNATPSIPNNRSQNAPSAPVTPSTTPGAASASSTAPAQATPPNQPATTGMPGVPAVPAPLLTIEQTGKSIYQSARNNHLDQAQQQLQTLKRSYSQLAATLNQPNTARHLPSQAKGRGGATGQLASTINLLQRALNARNRGAVMDYANQVVLSAANVSAHFNAHVPVNAVLLGVYARDLEIWGMKKDMSKLPFAARMIARTWQSFRPTVVAHNGSSEAGAFDQLVARLQQARSPADYQRLAQPLQAAAERIEKLFQ